LGVAVSGGGDSVALLHILSRCFDPDLAKLHVATVDHGLRPESASEADGVARLARQLGVPHDVLKWQDWDGTGNLQDQARRARYGLLTGWAKRHGIKVLALGHTADDQAETVLMRLARSSGVAGMSGIPVQRAQDGILFVRPLLRLTRSGLRDYLRRQDVGWIDDPSNDDLQYDRVKMRKALQVLAPLGITATALSDVARNMASARKALDWYSFLSSRETASIDGGDVILDLRSFLLLPDEISRQLLARAIMWIGNAEYPPRRAALSRALQAVNMNEPAVLGGCGLLRQGDKVRVYREFAAVRRHHCPAGEIWDQKWRLRGGDVIGHEIRPLGRHGLMQCADWRETGRPRLALTATPSVWRGDELIAAPLAGKVNGWQAEIIGGEEEFFASFLSH